MRNDLKIGLLVGMVLVIGIVMMVSLWPGQGVEERQQKTFQEGQIRLPIRTGNPSSEMQVDEGSVANETTVSDKPIVKNPALPPAVVKLPPAPAPPVKKQARIHTVGNGETLSSIAIDYYGSIRYIKKIVDANPNTLRDPDKLRIGMRLVIP